MKEEIEKLQTEKDRLQQDQNNLFERRGFIRALMEVKNARPDIAADIHKIMDAEEARLQI